MKSIFTPKELQSTLNPDLQLFHSSRWITVLMSQSIYLPCHVKIVVVNDEHLFVFFVFVSQLNGIHTCLEFFGYSWFQFLVINVGWGQHNPSVGVMTFNFKFPAVMCWHGAVEGCLRRVGAGACCCWGRRHAVGVSGVGGWAMTVPQLARIDTAIVTTGWSSIRECGFTREMVRGRDGRNRRDGRA